jgi:lipopolysaccharide biosynthesis glycosyltransferase
MNKSFGGETKMNIALSPSVSWLEHACVVMYSIFKHNPDAKVYLLCDKSSKEITDRFGDKVTWIPTSAVFEKRFKKKVYLHSHYTKEVYYRLLLPELIPDDRVLYLDTDLIVNGNLSEFYNLGFNGNLLAAVEDAGAEWYKTYIGFSITDKYFNAGVMLYDLKAIREEKLENKWIEMASKHKFHLQDQDILNVSCKGKILEVDVVYNVSLSTVDYDNPPFDLSLGEIIHFAGPKPWQDENAPMKEIWDSYKTEYKNMEAKP